MNQIFNVLDYPDGLEKAIIYIHGKWGREKNFTYYKDAIENSTNGVSGLPRFYLMVRGGEIIGCFALIINDFISRHDLYPWLACLFIEPQHRGQKLSALMFDHARKEAKAAGYSEVFLTTDHENFYEKFGWTRIEDGYDLNGERSKIYRSPT